MKRIPLTLVSGLALLSSIILFGYLGPIFIDVSNYEVASVMPSQPPSGELIFGSDSQGRDMLAVTIYSIPQTIKIAIIAGFFGIFIGLEGNIGCIVNGAGLAMATMDTIKLAGGEPANFLDIGGGATPERVAKAFRLVMSDDNVQAVLVNIFAGINRCDWVAEGVVQALREVQVNVPVIVRLAGTNVEEGQKILAKSGLPIIRATTLMEAAERSVQAWQSDSIGEPKLRAVK